MSASASSGHGASLAGAGDRPENEPAREGPAVAQRKAMRDLFQEETRVRMRSPSHLHQRSRARGAQPDDRRAGEDCQGAESGNVAAVGVASAASAQYPNTPPRPPRSVGLSPRFRGDRILRDPSGHSKQNYVRNRTASEVF
jgi:hypothetical protein